MAGALSAQTVAPPAAHRAPFLRDAVGVIRRSVILHRALAPRAQATRVTLAHAALVRPVPVAAEGAVGFCLRLTFAATFEIHFNLQGILKAARFDGKSLTLLFGAASQLSLHAERHLRTETSL